MNSFKELKKAYKAGKALYWNDPDPIEGNDYRITFIKEEDLEDIDEPLAPILIQYGGGAEAEVFLHEITYKT